MRTVRRRNRNKEFNEGNFESKRIRKRKIVILAIIPVIFILIIFGVIKLIGFAINSITDNSNEDLLAQETMANVENENKIEEYVWIDPYVNAEKLEYTGPIENVFFHPLVAYPELAFDGDYQSQGMDDYMATVPEFKRFIQELYNNNYILVNINEFYETITDENGVQKVKRKKVMFPVGKKPVVLSMDDMNYYDYMKENGCIYKLVIGDNGNVATYSIDPQGNEVYSYDNEVIPIIDNFVKEHPDFSFNGAKGFIGLTGYNGILGYNTNWENPNYQTEIEQAMKVVDRLKETGWFFASHSYTHCNFEKAGYDKIKYDTDKWKQEVESLVGPTQVFIYPYGAHEKFDSPEHEYLINTGGFKIFLGVGIRQYEKIYTNYVFMDRKNIDGITLRNRKKSVEHMFNTDTVIDLEARDRMKNM
ncbi:MAG: hypothetical protein E7311_00105 [Clostridiales bacterium]|nr:hypothetical protein [Clostridiales bacterium]